MRSVGAAMLSQLAAVSLGCRPGQYACEAGYSISGFIAAADTNWILFDMMRERGIDTLENKNPGPYTVFAPDERSFDDTGICEDYRDRSNCSSPSDKFTLTDFFMYHIVEGNFTIADLQEGQVLNTMFTGHQIWVDSIDLAHDEFGHSWQSMVLRSEDGQKTTTSGGGTEVTNGVIHFIDKGARGAGTMPILTPAVNSPKVV